LKGILNHAGKYGDFTYGLYLFAFPVQQMLISSGVARGNPWLLFLLTMLVITPLAILSWHLVEQRFLKLKGAVK
jgi:peptidoglycan/LPS O-acetylase OafA/YrhL